MDRGQGRGGRGGRGQGRGGRGGQGQGGGRGGPPHAPRMDSPSVSVSSTGSSGFGGGRGRGGGGGGGGHPGRGGGRGGPIQIFAAGRPAQPDARLAPRELDALTSKFRQLTTSVPDRVVRPGFGKQGAAITLRANFFALKYPKNLVLYDYAVKFTPEVQTKEKRTLKRLFELLESTSQFAPFLSDIAHDRTQRLISRRRLPTNLAETLPLAYLFMKKVKPVLGKVARYSLLNLPDLLSTDVQSLTGQYPSLWSTLLRLNYPLDISRAMMSATILCQ